MVFHVSPLEPDPQFQAAFRDQFEPRDRLVLDRVERCQLVFGRRVGLRFDELEGAFDVYAQRDVGPVLIYEAKVFLNLFIVHQRPLLKIEPRAPIHAFLKVNSTRLLIYPNTAPGASFPPSNKWPKSRFSTPPARLIWASRSTRCLSCRRNSS